MSPFTLDRKSLKPKACTAHRVLAIASLTIQISIFIYGCFHTEDYIDYSVSFLEYLIDIFSFSLFRVLSVVIVLESYLTRSHQMQFLCTIHAVDKIIVKELHSAIKWKVERVRNL